MASVDLQILQEKANSTRLSRLLVDKGTEALRSTFDTIHSPANLSAVLAANRISLLRLKPRVISNSQWDLLYPPSGNPPDSKTFDVTLLTVLFRNICGLPSTGWGAMPLDTDRSLQANITRIKLFRNEIYAHVTSTQVDNATFQSLWQKISQALVELNVPQHDVDELETCPLSSKEDIYVKMLEDWKLQEDKCMKVLEGLNNDDKSIKGIVEENQAIIKQQITMIEALQSSIKRTSQVSEDTNGKKKFRTGSDEDILRKLTKHNFRELSESWKSKKSSTKHEEKLKELLKYVQEHPNEVKDIGGMCICCTKPNFVIGKGSDGTRVYVGLSKDGFERAVKRLPREYASYAEKEMEVLTQRKTIESNNVIRYWFLDIKSDEENLFLILDLCEETLETYVDRESLDKLATTAPEIIRHVLKGLSDLHSGANPILHRDLKPSNILRDIHDKWLLADFGISRILRSDENTYESVQRGNKHWRAVETYHLKSSCDNAKVHVRYKKESDIARAHVRYKKESDIQVAGMVAYYIVTKGEHPFGEERHLLDNLLKGEPVGLDQLKDPALKDLLTWMLSHDPKDRPSAEEALKHPYLLTKEQQFELLFHMGNQPEIKTVAVNSNVVQQLNSDSTDWRTLMDGDVLKYLCTDFVHGKPRTYNYGSSWTGCLRLIRNINQHWTDPPRPKPQPEAFYLVGDPQEYFLKVFPNLPVVVHRIVRSCEWKERRELKKYFK